jgi:hypothetical protein
MFSLEIKPMKTILTRLVFTPLVLALSPLNAADTPGAADRYVQLYERIVSREATGATKLGAVQKLWLATAAARLAQRTGRADYRDQAVALFESALPEAAASKSDFHLLRGLALAVSQLRELKLIKPQYEQALRPFAEKAWQEFLASPEGTYEGDVDHNIRLAQADGCAAFVRFFKDDTMLDTALIRNRLEQYWSKIKATGDLDEDASNYTGLGIVHCIELAQMLGHEDDLRAPGFRRMFERQRDLISPTGRLPEFGDGFFHVERDAFDFVFICEYAAKMFDDPTFLTVARRLYDPEAFAKALPDGWCRALTLLGLECSQREPMPLPAASLVNWRMNRSSAQPVVDKLILRTGSQPGAAMLMLDLYAAGSHAHPSKGPSVAYFEAYGVPLFHNLGRHRTRSAITGNSFWALEYGRSFPGIWKPDEWFTMSIPSEMMIQAEQGTLKVGDRVTLRNFENNGTQHLWFDNLRLQGKAGVKLLDGFEGDKQWHSSLHKAPGLEIETSPDHTQGTASQSLNWGALPAGAYSRKLADAQNITFAPSDYDTMSIDVKYAGKRPYLHLRDLCQQVDLGDQVLPYRVGAARAEQRGRDAYGEVTFSRYIAADAQLTRRMVLAAEGCLVIRDRWSSGQSHPKWTAGQLWQYYALKEHGVDWFCSDDDGAYTVPNDRGGPQTVTRRMLVKFATDARTEAFVERIEQPYLAPNPKNRPGTEFFTTGCRRTVAAGEDATFALAVVPHDPALDAKTVAEGISFKERPDGVEVVFGPPAATAPIRVRFLDDGRWEVERHP